MAEAKAEDRRPKVKDRVALQRGKQEDQPYGQELAEEEWIVCEVTVLARDLEENVWTVWDHDEKALKMVSFDENLNWFWVEPAEEVTDDDS